MKYCVIGPTYPFRGGIAHFTTLLVHHLRERHDVRFYSYNRQYPRWFFPGNTNPDPSQNVLQEPSERTIDALNPFSWWQTARHIVADKPDILLLQWWTPFWLPLLFVVSFFARRHKIPILYLCHQLNEPDSVISEWLFARAALRLGNGIIVMTEMEFAFAQRGLPGKAIRVGHHPVYDGFPRRHLTRAQARQLVGIDSDAPLLLFFGFVRRYKGLPYLLEALAQLPQSIRLLVAGEFWEDEQTYRDLIARLGLTSRVVVHNRYVPNEDVEACFVATDALVLPYLSGSQSGVGMIAFNYALPIIATRIGGLAETVRDGETGLIVPPADSAALAGAIARFFGERLGAAFRSAVIQQRDRLSWSALIRIVEELSNDISSSNASRRAESAGATDLPIGSRPGVQ